MRVDVPLFRSVELARSRNGIAVAEFDFERPTPRKARYSCLPMLELLATSPAAQTPYVYWNLATRADLGHRLRQWTRRRRAMPILYIAGHGAPGVVNVGGGSRADNHVRIEDIARVIEGRARGCWLHLGSCEALDLHGGKLRAIVRRTGLAAISGYRQPVEYLRSSSFELLFLEALTERAIDGRGVAAMRRWAAQHARGPFARLDFRIVSL